MSTISRNMPIIRTDPRLASVIGLPIQAEQKRQLAYFCLLAFLFLLCGAVQSAFPQLNIVKPTQIMAIGAIVVGGVGKLVRREPFVFYAPSYLVLALMATVVLSVPGAVWPSLAFDVTVDALKMLLIFLVISNIIKTPQMLNGLAWAMCLGGLLPAMGTIKNYVAGTSLVDGYRGAWLGLYANPNDLSYAMAMLIPLAMALTAASSHRLAKLLASSCLGLFALTIFFTYSRMGFLCLVVIIVMTLWWSPQRKYYFLLISLMVMLCLPFVSGRYFQRVETITTYEQDRSSVGRLEAWNAGIQMFEEHPILGVGPGCYILGWSQANKEHYGAVRSAHNTFFQVLGELGLFGFIFFCAFLIASLRLIGRLRRVLIAAQQTLKPVNFQQQYGQLLPMVIALNIGIVVFLISSLTGGLLFTWYPYLFSAMGIAAQEIYQNSLTTKP